MLTATKLLVPLTAIVVLFACSEDGTTAREMERAAIDRTRQELGLSPSVPLKATVWVGKPRDDRIVFCGTVSSADGAPTAIAPHRFAATGDPIKFEIFEEAHSNFVSANPDMFLSWAEHCAGQQAA